MLKGNKSSLFALLSLVAVTAIWGWTFIIVKEAVSRMPVMDFLAVRFTIAAMCMVVIRPLVLRGMSRGDIWRGTVLGVILGLAFITQTFGLQTTSPAVSGFITGMGVVFTPVVAWLFLHDKIGLKTWLAVALATVGLGLLSLRGWSIGGGELLTVACAVFVALQINGLSRWSPGRSAYRLAFLQVAVTAVICLIFAAPGGYTLPPDSDVWLTIGITAVLASAVAFVVQTWAQSLLSSTQTAVVLTMEPVFAGVFAVALAGQQMTSRLIGGAVCVLAAMLLAQWKKSD